MNARKNKKHKHTRKGIEMIRWKYKDKVTRYTC